MSVEAFRRRILYRHLKPNPLFEDWLRELHEEAILKRSRLEPLLREAFESLQKYPLPLRSGADCAILKGFHKKICQYIDHRFTIYESIIIEELREHGITQSIAELDSIGNEISEGAVSTSNTNTGLAGRLPFKLGQRMPQHFVYYYFHNLMPELYLRNSVSRPTAPLQAPTAPSTSNTASSTSNGVQQAPYKPGYRTGGYAILLTLLKHSQGGTIRSMPRGKLMEMAQQYCDDSFTIPKPDSHSTAWQSMLILVNKGLVRTISNREIEFALSDEGKNLAIELLIEDTDRQQQNATENVTTVHPDMSTGGIIEFSPGSFDVILLIDKNETGGVSKKNEPTVALFKRYPRLKYEYRSLKVGDFTWIARHRDTGEELVLPHIVERKRMDDLAGSIKDGRFHEQKFRLHKCGLHNVYYMIESYGNNRNLGLPFQSLKQALANTRVQDGFKTIMSASLNHSVRLLSLLTLKLTAEYRDEHLKGRNDVPGEDELMSYGYFNKASAKNKSLTVKEMFIKQLLQLKGLSVPKALAITDQYPTPLLLVEEYRKHSQEEGQMLLSNLKYGELGRNVGPTISKTVHQLFTNTA